MNKFNQNVTTWCFRCSNKIALIHYFILLIIYNKTNQSFFFLWTIVMLLKIGCWTCLQEKIKINVLKKKKLKAKKSRTWIWQKMSFITICNYIYIFKKTLCLLKLLTKLILNINFFNIINYPKKLEKKIQWTLTMSKKYFLTWKNVR